MSPDGDASRIKAAVSRLASLLESKRARYATLTFVLIVLSAILLISASHKGGMWRAGRYNDFKAYHQATQAVLRADLPSAYQHAGRPYQYPPTLATLLTPMGLLPYRAALAIWIVGCLALLLWAFRATEEVLCPPVSGIDKFIGFLVVYRLVHSDFANGNANVLMLGILVLGFFLERRGSSLRAGGALALAASIKVAPILLLPWMLWRRRWRMSAGFLAGLLLWGVLVPATILGPTQFGESFRSWYGGLLAPMNVAAEQYEEPVGAYFAGQSIRSLYHHLLRATDASAHDDDVVFVNIVNWSKGTVDALYLITAALIFGATLWIFRGRDPTWSGSEIAAALLLTVLLSPLARKAHFVALYPAAVGAFTVVRMAKGRRRKTLGALYALAAALIILTAPGFLGSWLSKRAMAFCPLSWSAMILWVLLIPPRPGRR